MTAEQRWIVERLDRALGTRTNQGIFSAETEEDAARNAWEGDGQPTEPVYYRVTGPLPERGPGMLPPGTEFVFNADE